MSIAPVSSSQSIWKEPMKIEKSPFDKVLLKFFADVLYIKGILCSEELDDIYEAKNSFDLDNIFEKMVGDKYNVYRKGESYYIIHPRTADGE